MRQKTETTLLRRSATRLMAVVTAFLATVCWSGEAALGQSVIDMPPPRAATVQSESNAATSMSSVGELAMNRYGRQRAATTNTYGMYNRRYNRSWSYGYGYGYPVGYHGYGFGHPWYGCYGGASIRHVGGGRFVGTLLYR